MAEQLLVPEASLVAALLGLFSLLAGRKYFGIAFAAIGFFIAASAAKVRVGETTPDARTTILLLSTLVAIACGVFTKMFRNIATGMASYTIAGYILSVHSSSWGYTAVGDVRLTFVIGGILGYLLVAFAPEAGLILLSSLLGAHLILQYFTLEDDLRKWLFILLTLIGALIQGGILQKMGGGPAKETPKK
jgi:hypothetical protein